MHALCTLSLRLNAMKAKGGRWGFPLKPQNAHFCGSNESFQNQVLFALRMGRRTDATLTNLFNFTSGRDTSHLCLISTWPKEWCTIVCVIMWASLKNCTSHHMHYALLRVHRLTKGEGRGFPLSPKRYLFVGGTNLSLIRYCSLWEWVEKLMPSSDRKSVV